MSKKYKVSEIFYSPQGEGRYTGQLTAWVRAFTCNLQCNGFGQKDPTDPASYILPYKTFDVSNIKRIEDLPVFDYGCDSSYSWSAKFKHLCPDLTSDEIATRLLDLLPGRSFKQKHTNIHLAFTGGEPLLPKGQLMIMDALDSLYLQGEFPINITIETNGTQKLTDDFQEFVNAWYWDMNDKSEEMFFSISPKLFNVSGESRDKAIDESAIKTYKDMPGQLKFVVNESDSSWKEMEEVIEIYNDNGVFLPVWIMPVGATAESQNTDHIKRIALKAMANGYNISARVHTYIFGNQIGT